MQKSVRIETIPPRFLTCVRLTVSSPASPIVKQQMQKWCRKCKVTAERAVQTERAVGRE